MIPICLARLLYLQPCRLFSKQPIYMNINSPSARFISMVPICLASFLCLLSSQSVNKPPHIYHPHNALAIVTQHSATSPMPTVLHCLISYCLLACILARTVSCIVLCLRPCTFLNTRHNTSSCRLSHTYTTDLFHYITVDYNAVDARPTVVHKWCGAFGTCTLQLDRPLICPWTQWFRSRAALVPPVCTGTVEAALSGEPLLPKSFS
jgi:hypothetical protein